MSEAGFITEHCLWESIKKFQSIIDRVESEFQQTEEYRAREEHRRILKEHNQRVAEFKEKYDASESQYNDCYDVFGNLRSPDALKKIKADYKAKRDYERRSQEWTHPRK